MVRRGSHVDAALEEAQEHEPAVATAPAVETKDEPVKVERDVVPAGAALVGAEHPALEERGDSVDPGQMDDPARLPGATWGWWV